MDDRNNEQNPLLGARRHSGIVEAGRLLVMTALITAGALALVVFGGIAWWLVTCSNDPTAAHCRIG